MFVCLGQFHFVSIGKSQTVQNVDVILMDEEIYGLAYSIPFLALTFDLLLLGFCIFKNIELTIILFSPSFLIVPF